MLDSVDANGNGKRDSTGIPSMGIFSRNTQFSDGEPDGPDFDFNYADADTLENEIAELYSYTEHPEFALNLKAFEDTLQAYNYKPYWQKIDLKMKYEIVDKLLNQLDFVSAHMRMQALRTLLYIAQGCWSEAQSDTELQGWTKENVLLLYTAGVFPSLVKMLDYEIENKQSALNASRKLALSIHDSTEIRVILSTMYIMLELLRRITDADSEEYIRAKDAFKSELLTDYGDELLAIKLFGMLTRFCSGTAPHFPMKKVLLLLWKVILFTLGGFDELRKLRLEYRRQAGLPDMDEDAIEIMSTIRASSPPPSAGDLIDVQHPKRSRPFRKSLIKQSSLDEPCIDFENDGGELTEMRDFDRSMEDMPSGGMDASLEQDQLNDSTADPTCENDSSSPRMETPAPVSKGLPWTPKVRLKDLDAFLDSTRMKFVGYSLPGDRDTIIGLPQPICESVKVLKKHMYTSLSEKHIEEDEQITKNPFSHSEENILNTPVEAVYQAMFPNFVQYMISLLKILLAAAPTSKTKTESINIVADVLPVGMPFTVVQSMKLGIDVNRHKEIMVKAITGIMLLLLKHLKLNHFYQFEHLAQNLVYANCIPLVLKYFNQNILTYISARNVIPILEYPNCVIGEQPELKPETFDLEIGDSHMFSWRNLFASINMLRILNKITKYRHSRVMMLIVFKSAPILKKTLKVRHSLMQLYVLKLLKMQTKYLGRQWRKANMKTISAIYQKCRHRLSDDWAFGNEIDQRPWENQEEECHLRVCVDRFNNRRYYKVPADPEFVPYDTWPISVLNSNVDLDPEFMDNYEVWLKNEVYDLDVNWDELLIEGCV